VAERCFKQSEGFVEQDVSGELILVPLVDSVAKMNEVITLNELGAFIYKMLKEPMSFENILSNVLQEYDVEKEKAIADLNNFLESALEKKIVLEK
jgi:predicted nucleotidyltransferase